MSDKFKKARKILEIRYKKTIKEYLDNPNVCFKCGKNLLYKKRKNKFCSSSCANGYNNIGRKYTDITKKKISVGVKNAGYTEEWLENNRKAMKKVCKNPDRNKKISETRKRLYQEGKLKIHGGRCLWHTVKTLNGTIRVQGTYEVRMCKILDIMQIRKEIKNWEYTKDRFKYIMPDGSEHNYLIDFKIFNNDNTFYYIECKGWKHESDYYKWESVKKLGFNIMIFFGKDIKELENKYMAA